MSVVSISSNRTKQAAQAPAASRKRKAISQSDDELSSVEHPSHAKVRLLHAVWPQGADATGPMANNPSMQVTPCARLLVICLLSEMEIVGSLVLERT